MSLTLSQKHKCMIAAVWLIVSLKAMSITAAGEVHIVPAGQRQLFPDDGAIAKIDSLRRALH